MSRLNWRVASSNAAPDSTPEINSKTAIRMGPFYDFARFCGRTLRVGGGRDGESGRHFYQLRAWVIIPNHVHIVLLPKTSLPVILRWWKGATARPANLIPDRTGPLPLRPSAVCT